MSLSIHTDNHVRSPYPSDAAAEVSAALTTLLADTFALYLKTKSFHWHMAPTGFGIFQPLLDEQAEQILSITDIIAERIRELGGTTLHSIGHIGRLQRLADNDTDYLTPAEMLTELASDNRQLSSFLRTTRDVCDMHWDFQTAEYFETWIDEADGRTWFLVEAWRAHLRSIPTTAAALQAPTTLPERLTK
ncbi:Dps family protein [Phyllobacterium endophyticum]|uniref:DNA starvation/stationary phase protection protein n=1 Tax=Phyllobacterium endophyticum TaxID=1149773 RepID=A0A2P7B0Q2_9HYPH|nr:DNA starvation/stationary phase protection protein [Phyllobacterium endophyticum]MBB3237568.1 starvation-inducible DNA-binding protein [Phyllobacterium endophyticum]PSH60042.1 DNA starvation/stationary phase protection protein [Phyllobacterium endophyticum]TYR42209.1 DNA starvation/stationary phase protection protein [Phyllobacterium endophyticum]